MFPLGKYFPKLLSLRTAFDDVVNRSPGTTLPTIPHPRKFLVCSVDVKSGYYDRFSPVENENVVMGNIYANQVSYYKTKYFFLKRVHIQSSSSKLY